MRIQIVKKSDVEEAMPGGMILEEDVDTDMKLLGHSKFFKFFWL